MNKKTIIKIVIGIGAAAVIGIIALLVIKLKKPDELRLGMSQDEVMLIMRKNKYECGTMLVDRLYGINEEFSINHVKGYCQVYFDNHKLTRITFLVYLFDINGDDIDSLDEQNRKADLLKKYLNKKYGEPIEKGIDEYGYLTMTYEKGDMNIMIRYPEENTRGATIEVEWYYKKL